MTQGQSENAARPRSITRTSLLPWIVRLGGVTDETGAVLPSSPSSTTVPVQPVTVQPWKASSASEAFTVTPLTTACTTWTPGSPTSVRFSVSVKLP